MTECNTKCVILDTETDGLENHGVIELAYLPVEFVGDGQIGISGDVFDQRYQTPNPIQLGASLVHGILPEDLDGCPVNTRVAGDLPDDLEYMIAHKVQYDWNSLGQPDVKTICTLAIAQTLYPDFDSHKQGALYLEFFKPTRENLDYVRSAAHGALADISMLHKILVHMLSEKAPHVKTVEDLYDFSEVCRKPKVMPFGKHRGVAISDIPPDYLRWMVNTLKEDSDADPYLLTALREARGEHFKRKSADGDQKSLF